MVRAAAKNHAWVGIITSTSQYGPVLEELRASGSEHGKSSLSEKTRRGLALEAFASTAAYDAAIVEWLSTESGDDPVLPQHLDLALEKTGETLRYGENPHQRGARYRLRGTTSWWDDVTQHSGLALSYLNYYDTDAAWIQVHDLGDRPAVAIIKHANPCGVAIADDLATAYQPGVGVRRALRVRWDRRAEPSARRRDRSVDGRRPAGRRGDRAGLHG